MNDYTPPRGPQTVQVEELEADGLAAEPIELPIGGGAATGYKWTLELPPGVERIEDGAEREVDPAVRLGSGTGAHLRVKAVKGEHVVVARLARPWEPTRPIRVVRLSVHAH
jgi:predicted secreted protein